MEKQRQRAPFNEVERYVKTCKYPCSKEDLIDCARGHKAPYEVIRTLEVMRPETKFDDLNDVREGVERVFR